MVLSRAATHYPWYDIGSLVRFAHGSLIEPLNPQSGGGGSNWTSELQSLAPLATLKHRRRIVEALPRLLYADFEAVGASSGGIAVDALALALGRVAEHAEEALRNVSMVRESQ